MRCIRGALLAVLGLLAATPRADAQQPAVKGDNVRAVVYQKMGKVAGVLVQGAGKTWYEDNADGRQVLTEVARDEWSVYYSKADGGLVQIDLYTKTLNWVNGPLTAAEKLDYTVALRRKQALYTLSNTYTGKGVATDSGNKVRTENTFRAVVYENAGKVVGLFSQVGVTAWYEDNADGRFALNELLRDEWSVYLLKADGALIQLDLYEKKVYVVGGPLSAAEMQNLGTALRRRKAMYTVGSSFKGRHEAAAVNPVVPGPGPGPVVPAGQKRPFFVIGHHANTEQLVNDYVTAGANMIECDIHMYSPPLRFSGSDQLYVIHFAKDEFTRKYTNSDGTAAYFRNIKAKMDAGQLSGLLLDIKNTLTTDGPVHLALNYPDPRRYGRVMADHMKRAGIPANRVIMGVEQKATAGLAPSAATWVDEFMKGVRWDAKYDCMLDMYVAASGDANTWANTLNGKSDVASTGMDSSVRGNFSGYKSYLEAAVQRRNAKSGDLRFVYFWTVNDDGDIRKSLDVGVDGLITDKADLVKKIVSEAGYQAKYRLADRNDLPIPAADRVKRSMDDPFVYLTLRHQGGYVAKFYVTWTDPQGRAQSHDFGQKTLGWTHTHSLPRGSTNIRVHAQAAVFIGTWKDIYNGGVSPGTYTAGGTTLNRTWNRN